MVARNWLFARTTPTFDTFRFNISLFFFSLRLGQCSGFSACDEIRNLFHSLFRFAAILGPVGYQGGLHPICQLRMARWKEDR